MNKKFEASRFYGGFTSQIFFTLVELCKFAFDYNSLQNSLYYRFQQNLLQSQIDSIQHLEF
jgi:hypothetical protein